MFLAGEIRETSQSKVLKQLQMLQQLEWFLNIFWILDWRYASHTCICEFDCFGNNIQLPYYYVTFGFESLLNRIFIWIHVSLVNWKKFETKSIRNCITFILRNSSSSCGACL
jgi:hypothetical protein